MTLRILTVCTANVCRSPMAAALLASHCQQRGVDAVVHSAGTDTTDLPVDPVAVAVMARYGLDISAHRPRSLVRKLVESDGADLVLAMTRQHLRAAATMTTGAFCRTFSATEFARLAATHEPTPRLGLHDWLKLLADGRHARDLMGDDPIDDIADPHGASLAMYHLCAAELNRLTDVVARTLATLAGRPDVAAVDYPSFTLDN